MAKKEMEFEFERTTTNSTGYSGVGENFADDTIYLSSKDKVVKNA